MYAISFYILFLTVVIQSQTKPGGVLLWVLTVYNVYQTIGTSIEHSQHTQCQQTYFVMISLVSRSMIYVYKSNYIII